MQRVALALCAVSFSVSLVAGCSSTEPAVRDESGAAAAQATAGVETAETQFQNAVDEINELVRAGESAAAKEIAKQLQAEFPDRVGPDLDLYVAGELYYWSDRYDKALVKYEKLLKDYPGSEFADEALNREYEIGQAYLQGRKKVILGFIKLSGYAEGVEIMEKVSDRAGLDEPNGIGLKAAIAVAEHYERQEKYLDAYLKWSEIASYWETGPVGKLAMFRMAEDNLAAYKEHPPGERYRFDASKLTTAKTYYEKYLALYPQDAAREDVPEKIKEINELMAYKQFKIAQYYQHTGQQRAAYLYLDMVIHNWPDTEAAGLARQAMAEWTDGEQARGT